MPLIIKNLNTSVHTIRLGTFLTIALFSYCLRSEGIVLFTIFGFAYYRCIVTSVIKTLK